MNSYTGISARLSRTVLCTNGGIHGLTNFVGLLAAAISAIPVTRTVREGASVLGPALYSTLDILGEHDRAKGSLDGG